jgi:hypothetical protein
MNKNTFLLIVLAILVVGGGYWYMKSKNTAGMMSGSKEGAAVVTEAPVQMMQVDLAEQPNSAVKQKGTAILEEKDGKVVVTVSVEPGTKVAQPAHIHSGACPTPGDVVYPLSNVVDGKSTTTLDVTMADLKAQMPLVINVHKSQAEAKVYTACGDLK